MLASAAAAAGGQNGLTASDLGGAHCHIPSDALTQGPPDGQGHDDASRGGGGGGSSGLVLQSDTACGSSGSNVRYL